MAIEQITVELTDQGRVDKLRELGLGEEVETKLSIWELQTRKQELQDELKTINEDLDELRK